MQADEDADDDDHQLDEHTGRMLLLDLAPLALQSEPIGSAEPGGNSEVLEVAAITHWPAPFEIPQVGEP